MDTNVNYTIVGAFVIFLVTAIIFSIIWLSSGFSFATFSKYMVYMQESVSGLSVDAPVEFNGVEVGTVQSVGLDTKNPEVVELVLNVKKGTPVTRGTTATLQVRGITGIAYIALKDKSTDLRPLKKERGQPYPVIPTAPSLFMRLDTIVTQLTTNFTKVTNAIDGLLSPENQESIKETLVNLNKITTDLAGNTARFNKLLDNTYKASTQLGPLIKTSTSTMQMLETQTLPAAYQMLNNLEEVSRTLLEVSNEIKRNPSVLIRGKASPQLGPGESR